MLKIINSLSAQTYYFLNAFLPGFFNADFLMPFMIHPVKSRGQLKIHLLTLTLTLTQSQNPEAITLFLSVHICGNLWLIFSFRICFANPRQ